MRAAPGVGRLSRSANRHEFTKWPKHVSQLFLVSCHELRLKYFFLGCVIALKGSQVQQMWFGVGDDTFNICLRSILTSAPGQESTTG